MTFAATLRLIGLPQLLWQERRVLLLALVSAVLGPIASLALPFAAKLVIDEVVGHGRDQLLVPITLLGALGVLLQAGTSYGATNFGGLAGQRVVTRLQQRIQRHTVRLPARFFDAEQSGALVSRIIADPTHIRALAGAEMLQLVSGMIAGIAAFVVLVWINAQVAFLVFALLLGVIFLLTGSFRRLHPAFQITAELQGALAGRLTQVLGGIMVVKTCGAERRESHLFGRDSHRLLRASVAANRQVAGAIAAIALGTGGMGLVLLIVGGRAVGAGAMSLGDLALCIVLVGMLSTPVVQAAAVGSELGRARAALARIAEVLALPIEQTGDARVRRVPSGLGAVLFDDVTYAYHGGHPVLRGVTFSALPGTVTVLTGPNGAGKSTLLALLMGLDSPTSGRILLDGWPLGELRLAEYRRSLGVVLQQNTLFAGTVEDNIRYARPTASTAEFRRAARLAHCDEFAQALPQGYRTLVGEQGATLSGGQRQRIAIARAFLADPRILLLDEAGSQLDDESERLLQEAVAALCGGRTTFVVTHRLATMRRADQVLELRRGEIVRRGTRSESSIGEALHAG